MTLFKSIQEKNNTNSDTPHPGGYENHGHIKSPGGSGTLRSSCSTVATPRFHINFPYTLEHVRVSASINIQHPNYTQPIINKLLLTGVGIIDLNICSAAIVTKNLDSIEPHSNLPQEL